MPNTSHPRAPPAIAVASSSQQAPTSSAAAMPAWEAKPSPSHHDQLQLQQQQGALPCGVGVLEGPAGAKSRCAREEGTSARCECGRHTFLLASSASTSTSAAADENQPPASSSLPPQPQPQPQPQQPLARAGGGGGAKGSSSTDLTELAAAAAAAGGGGGNGSSSSKRGRVPSGETPTNGAQQRRISLLPERSEAGDIENISASMVQAMARDDSSSAATTGSGSGSSHHQQVVPVATSVGQGAAVSVPVHHHHRQSSGVGRDEPPAPLPLDRIVVEPNGDMVLIEPSVVCDACPACDDVCAVPACRGCAEKRAALLARGEMCFVDAKGRRIVGGGSNKPSSSSSSSCVPMIGKPRGGGGGSSSSVNGGGGGATYTLCEIRRHRTLASCWLVAKGQVYDATRYLSSHPAGAIAIARKAGGHDCSEDLDFHSGRAQKLWRGLRIGAVVGCPAASSGPVDEYHHHQRQRQQAGRHRREDSASLVGSSCSIM